MLLTENFLKEREQKKKNSIFVDCVKRTGLYHAMCKSCRLGYDVRRVFVGFNQF